MVRARDGWIEVRNNGLLFEVKDFSGFFPVVDWLTVYEVLARVFYGDYLNPLKISSYTGFDISIAEVLTGYADFRNRKYVAERLKHMTDRWEDALSLYDRMRRLEVFNVDNVVSLYGCADGKCLIVEVNGSIKSIISRERLYAMMEMVAGRVGEGTVRCGGIYIARRGSKAVLGHDGGRVEILVQESRYILLYATQEYGLKGKVDRLKMDGIQVYTADTGEIYLEFDGVAEDITRQVYRIQGVLKSGKGFTG